jgi:hypothetical protein
MSCFGQVKWCGIIYAPEFTMGSHWSWDFAFSFVFLLSSFLTNFFWEHSFTKSLAHISCHSTCFWVIWPKPRGFSIAVHIVLIQKYNHTGKWLYIDNAARACACMWVCMCVCFLHKKQTEKEHINTGHIWADKRGTFIKCRNLCLSMRKYNQNALNI